jgi:hypothetical protein
MVSAWPKGQEVNSKSTKTKEALARFIEQVSKLSSDDLLDLKLAFDRLPPPEASERNFRRAQLYTLGAALLQEFGVRPSRCGRRQRRPTWRASPGMKFGSRRDPSSRARPIVPPASVAQ